MLGRQTEVDHPPRSKPDKDQNDGVNLSYSIHNTGMDTFEYFQTLALPRFPLVSNQTISRETLPNSPSDWFQSALTQLDRSRLRRVV